MTACPVCAGDRWDPLFTVEGGSYVACPTCGTARLDPLPDAPGAAQLYGEEYFVGGAVGGYADYDADAALHRRNARDRLQRLAALAPHPGPLLDVGAASGFLLSEAAAAGWTPSLGVDVSPSAREAAARRGVTVVAALDDPMVSAAGPFTAVSFFQSLEHVVDPWQALVTARELTADGGALIVESWDRRSRVARLLGRRWQQVSPPTVLWLFHAEGLAAMAVRAGFTAPRVTATSKRVSAGLVLSQLGARRRSPALQRLAGSPFGRLGVPYRLGDLVTLTARG